MSQKMTPFLLNSAGRGVRRSTMAGLSIGNATLSSLSVRMSKRCHCRSRRVGSGSFSNVCHAVRRCDVSQPGSPGGDGFEGLLRESGCHVSESNYPERIASTDGTFHLQVDEPIDLDRKFHRQLLDDRLDESVDDHRDCVLFLDAAALQVE